jgi:predicted metal-dependent HD superfamily phosphohydrolase
MSPDTSKALEARWTDLICDLGVSQQDACRAFAILANQYNSSGRYYHTLAHIAAMLDSLARLADQGKPDPALLLAVWFHDAVYDSRAQNNEEQSAALAATMLGAMGLPESVITEVGRLILLTKSHQAEPADGKGQLLLDADLAVLGAEPAQYDAYAAAIRREYAWVPEADYRTGRCRVLEAFLQRPRIFATRAFAALEPAARANLRREIVALGNLPQPGAASSGISGR